MVIITFKRIRHAFLVICLAATAALLIFSISRFLKDDDISLVKDVEFSSTQDAIYPSISFYIVPPFLENNFKIFGNDEINMTSYVNFLKGNFSDERFLSVEYDNVTISLADNLLDAKYRTYAEKTFNWNPTHYVSFRSPHEKCFTIDTPNPEDDYLLHYRISIDGEIFPEGKRSQTNRIKTYLHYPGQRFIAFNTLKANFASKQNTNNYYTMFFKVRNIDVITRRNKIHEACVEDWKNYDNKLLEFRINRAGCHPPYWKTQSKLPVCANAFQMELPQTHNAPESFGLPCKMVERLDFSYREIDHELLG